MLDPDSRLILISMIGFFVVVGCFSIGVFFGRLDERERLRRFTGSISSRNSSISDDRSYIRAEGEG